METTFVLAFVLLIVGFMIYTRRKNAAERKEDKKKDDARWAVAYNNPASPNYDPARVAADEAAAWAQDETNPASPNYDPNA